MLRRGRVWLLIELRRQPRASSSTRPSSGLQNGALYALIALGYTLVYGIIELINFAHGDLFMLGTLFSGFMLTTTVCVQRRPSARRLGRLLGHAGRRAWPSARSINVAIEFLAYRRLRRAPKLAPLITAVGMSFILQFVGLQWNGSHAASSGRACCRRAASPSAASEIDYDFFVVLARHRRRCCC